MSANLKIFLAVMAISALLGILYLLSCYRCDCGGRMKHAGYKGEAVVYSCRKCGKKASFFG